VFNNGVAILGSLVDGKRKKVLRAQSGNMGWESGTYKVTVKGAVVETGKFLSVSRKKDGKWHYVRDTRNADAPVAATAPAPTAQPAAKK
jgi:hypothetical protein